MGSGLYFEERGSHELKGVPGRWRLMAVAGEGNPAPMQARRDAAATRRSRPRAVARSFPGACAPRRASPGGAVEQPDAWSAPQKARCDAPLLAYCTAFFSSAPALNFGTRLAAI